MTSKDNVGLPFGDLVRCFLTHYLKHFVIVCQKRVTLSCTKLLSSGLADEDERVTPLPKRPSIVEGVLNPGSDCPQKFLAEFSVGLSHPIKKCAF